MDEKFLELQVFLYFISFILQGDKAVRGIIMQLERIKKGIYHFGLVAISRDGGGDNHNL
ncbi:hypothetical protein [Flavobacterium sp. LB2R40]|uniref:hypothetical protein n=1 Tax=unclassified Flavobacterium TaxID=196869 RepID=UPI003AAF8992